jgi:hypothetical protein
MFTSLWRWLRNGSPIPGGKSRRSGRRLSYRPGLEPLEGRELPALPGGGFIALTPVLDALSVPWQVGSQPSARPTPIRVTVAQNAPETVLNLGPVFAAMPGLQHEAGLQYSILGNSNSGLVRTDLSGAALTLTYTRGMCGMASITVNATDADRVSVQQTILVTVLPASPPGAVGVSPIAVPHQISAPIATSV